MNHRCKFRDASPVALGKIAVLSGLAPQAGHLTDESMKVSVGIIDVALRRFIRIAQTECIGVMDNQPILLLAIVDAAPTLTVLRFKAAANLLVHIVIAFWCLLQRRV